MLDAAEDSSPRVTQASSENVPCPGVGHVAQRLDFFLQQGWASHTSPCWPVHARRFSGSESEHPREGVLPSMCPDVGASAVGTGEPDAETSNPPLGRTPSFRVSAVAHTVSEAR